MDKKIISVEQAEDKLFTSINQENIGDRIYEFVQELFQNAVAGINDEFQVVGCNGEAYDGEDGCEWQDESYEEFHQKAYDLCLAFLSAR